MSSALPDALTARLVDEETKLLRVIHRFVPITELTFVDEAGEMLIPCGQTVTLRLVPCDGSVTLLHTCLVGTPAEIDFLLRARLFYLAHASAMSDVIPVLVTLNIDPLLKAAAANAGISVATVLIGNEQAPSFDLSRSGSSPAMLSSSGTGRLAHSQSPSKREDAPKPPLANGTGFSSAAYKPAARGSPLSSSTSSISSTSISEPVGRAHSATDVNLDRQPSVDALRTPSMSDPPQKKSAATLSPAPTPPSPSVPGVPKVAPATPDPPAAAPRSAAVLAWRAFLAASGIETPLVPTLADAIAARGILLPSNPADMPWEKLKETDGVKMGHITRMKKYAASRVPT